MNKVLYVIGVVDSGGRAEVVVSRLLSSGFHPDQISVLFPESKATADFAKEKNTHAPEGAAIGAGTGGALGATLGTLAGLGALVIPGLGPILAAGPIIGAVTGLAAGATVGGLTGALLGWGVPEAEARRYEASLKDGRVIVAVHTAQTIDRRAARNILLGAGAVDVSDLDRTDAARGEVA